MLVTLATFHSERSELKTSACQNTAEVSKREKERIEREQLKTLKAILLDIKKKMKLRAKREEEKRKAGGGEGS